MDFVKISIGKTAHSAVRVHFQSFWCLSDKSENCFDFFNVFFSSSFHSIVSLVPFFALNWVCNYFVWLFSALCWCRGLGAVNKPTLLCCLKLWNMMGLSVTTHQLFHEQTMNFAIKLQRKYASSGKHMVIVCVLFLCESFWFWDVNFYWKIFGFEMIYKSIRCRFINISQDSTEESEMGLCLHGSK